MLDSLLQKGKRAKLIKEISANFAYENEVLRAMNVVPRHLFIDSGLEHLAYEDKPLPIAAK
ncbi:MAG: protein-L-isoaspartate O-methyltransferase, partial [Bacteroidales bacterium]